MAKCMDFWCENYNKNKGNCGKCIKNDAETAGRELDIILQRRAVRQMELGVKNKTNGQKR